MPDSKTPQELVAELDRRGGSVLFYPSAGLCPGTLLELPYNVFVLVDKGPAGEAAAMARWHKFAANCRFDEASAAQARYMAPAVVGEIGTKWVFFFNSDNNEALGLLQAAKVRLKCLLGIQDGCIDGGNYECVNAWQFLAKCFSLTHPDGMDYYLNHSWLLDRWNERRGYWDTKPWPNSPEGPYPEFILGSGHMRLVWHAPGGRDENGEADASNVPQEAQEFRRYVSVGQDELIRYIVTHHTPTVHTYSLGNILLTLEHDNIANHLLELDGAVVSKRAEKVCKASCNPGMNYGSNVAEASVPTQLEHVPGYFHLPHLHGKNSGDSAAHVLELAAINGWNVVGTTASGGGEHQRMLEVLASWDKHYPTHVRIFYLDGADYSDITGNYSS